MKYAVYLDPRIQNRVNMTIWPKSNTCNTTVASNKRSTEHKLTEMNNFKTSYEYCVSFLTWQLRIFYAPTSEIFGPRSQRPQCEFMYRTCNMFAHGHYQSLLRKLMTVWLKLQRNTKESKQTFLENAEQDPTRGYMCFTEYYR